jgi:hypothetical protein
MRDIVFWWLVLKNLKVKLKNQKPTAVDDFFKAYPMIPLSFNFVILMATKRYRSGKTCCNWIRDPGPAEIRDKIR